MPSCYKSFVLLTALAVLIPAAAGAQVADHRAIEFPPLEEFEIPRPEVFELDNGLRVFLLEDHELPLVRVLVRVRTGSVWEPPEKVGLADILGDVQRTGGAGSMSGDQIDDFLEARAASVETSVGNTVGFASMDCLKGDFDEVFAVFHDVLRRPRFAEDKIEIAKVQANSAIARRNDNVLAITSREFSRLVYGPESALARLEQYDTVGAVTRDDLVAWHARYYHPNNMLLGVVGDFETAAMKDKIGQAFASWPAGPAFDESQVAFRQQMTAGVYFIEKSDVTQANVRVGHLGITVDHPDYFAVQVMNEILGGSFSSRMVRRIRSEKGLAYSVGGSVGASFLYPGVAGFGLQTKSETMGEAVEALYGELRRMIEEPATAEELGRAKDSILNSFIFNYASKDQVLGQQMLYSYYGLPLDFLEKYRGNIEKVTAEDVARVARDHLHPDRATLLVVGRSADFDRPVSSFGPVETVDITIPAPAAAPAAERTAESLAAGRDILAGVLAAMGGDGREQVESVRSSDSVVVSMGGETMAMSQTVLLAFPDRIHVSMRLPMGERLVVISGGEGYVSMGGQVQPMPSEMVEEQLADLGRNLSYLVRFGSAEDLAAVAAGEDEVDGAPCRVVEVEFRGAASRLCVSGEGLVLKQTYNDDHPFTGAPGEFEVLFSDYREIDGAQVPFLRVTRVDGAELSTATRETYEINPAYDAALFEKPAA